MGLFIWVKPTRFLQISFWVVYEALQAKSLRNSRHYHHCSPRRSLLLLAKGHVAPCVVSLASHCLSALVCCLFAAVVVGSAVGVRC